MKISILRNIIFAASAALTLIMFVITLLVVTSTGELNNEQDQWFVIVGQIWLASLFLSLIVGIVEDSISQKTSDIDTIVTNRPIEGWYNDHYGIFHLTYNEGYYTLHHNTKGIISDYMSEKEAKLIYITNSKPVNTK